MNSLLDQASIHFPPRFRWLVSPTLWLAAFWFVAIIGLGERIRHGQKEFANESSFKDEQRRPTGGRGHLQIDFAGQWMMGRIVATGNASRLYDRNMQWKIAREGFPRENEPPYLRETVFPQALFPGKGPDDQIDHDSETLMSWLMGHDDPAWQQVGPAIGLSFLSQNPLEVTALLPVMSETLTPSLVESVNQPQVSGPLYPPIQGFLYAPFGMISKPETAYYLAQIVMVLIIVLSAFGITYMSRGQIWTPIAIILLVMYPGCRSSIDLGQNATLSSCIVIWGWALVVRKRDLSAGVVFGMLAFKPVWALSFLLANVLARKWRTAGVMCGVGLLQIVLTLPFVGVHSWKDWLKIGNEASECYTVNKNWIELSRDLGGVVRRPLIDFKKPEDERSNPQVDRLAAIVLFTVFLCTVIISQTCSDHSTTGLSAGFILVGSFLCCYRFMYYDTLISTVAFAAIFSNTKWAERPGDDWFFKWCRPFMTFPFAILFLLLFCENTVTAWDMKGKISMGILGDSKNPPSLTWEISYRWAWDTLLLLVLWFGLGAKLILTKFVTFFFDSEPAAGTESANEVNTIETVKPE